MTPEYIWKKSQNSVRRKQNTLWNSRASSATQRVWSQPVLHISLSQKEGRAKQAPQFLGKHYIQSPVSHALAQYHMPVIPTQRRWTFKKMEVQAHPST